MAKTTDPVFTQNITNTGTTFTSADTTTYKTIATAGSDDSRIVGIALTTDDTAGNTCSFAINDGSNDFLIASPIVLGAGAGTDGATAGVEALASDNFVHRMIDNNANPFLLIKATYTLKMKMDTTMTAAKTTTVLVTQEDY